MGLSVLFSVGCSGGGNGGGHTHVFDCEVVEERYFKSDATCTEAKQYCYSCACGEKGEETFSVGVKGLHNYSAQTVEEKYLKSAANCQAAAVYYKSCTSCGRASTSDTLTFSFGELGDHEYSQKVAREEFLKEEATKDSAAVYYQSCICGKS